MHLRLATIALLATTAAGAQSPTDGTIDRAVAAWSKVKTSKGTFEQTVSNSLTGGSAVAKGSFQQERPNRLAIRFTDPAGDAIVADGKALWVYLPSSAPGQVIKRPATERSAVPIDFAGEFLDAPRAKYDIADGGRQTVDGRATRVLKLVPKKNASAPFTRATVWVDDEDALVRQFEVAESNGVVRKIRLISLAVNAPVDRAAFSFTPPKGAKIVER